LGERPIWQDENCQRHGALQGDARADVVFVGGGLTALTAAWLLSRQGVRTAVLEARMVGSGSSGAGLGVLSTLEGLRADALLQRLGEVRAAAVLRAHARAVSLLAGIIAEEEITCELAAEDVSIYADREHAEAMRREHRALERLGVAAALMEAPDMPLHPAWALRLECQATLHPGRLLCALVSAVTRRGGHVYENSPVVRLSGGTAFTAQGSCHGYNTVVTARPLLQLERLQTTNQRMATLQGAPAMRGVWLPAAGGAALRAKGDMLLAAMTGPRDDGGEALRHWIGDNMNGVETVRQWSSNRSAAADGLPLVGVADPRKPTELLAVGCSRWGLAQEVAAAQVLCDGILDRPNELAEVFSPTRRDLGVARMALVRAGMAVEAAMAFATRWRK
jgi:glycine/D-amino acid oxidase-like deaminating enzyme